MHPYNDPRVIAGQGTCSKEFMEQVDGLDMMVAPIGGGGMISGTCLTLSTLAPETKIIAAEPEQADDAYRSFKAGYIIADDAPKTIADGLPALGIVAAVLGVIKTMGSIDQPPLSIARMTFNRSFKLRSKTISISPRSTWA